MASPADVLTARLNNILCAVMNGISIEFKDCQDCRAGLQGIVSEEP